MTELQWSFQVDPPAADVAELREELVRYNVHASDIAQSKDLAVFIHDSSGKLVGGVTGNLWGSVLEIDFLWLHANLRAAGLGKQILSRLEQEARMRGCSA